MIEKFMSIALSEAEKAAKKGEIPIGAVVEKNGEVLAKAHNLTETAKDPTAHAEILAIRKACEKLGSTRLFGANLYVTCEPCSMCSGAIVLARIDNLYIGTRDRKTGACGSALHILQNEALNHKVNVRFDILQEECSETLKSFFAQLRKRGKRY